MADPASVAGSLGVDWKTVALSTCSILMTILGFIVTGLRSEMRKQADELDKISRTYVSKDEMAKALDRVETRIEERHQENRAAWQGISNKIDVNEDKEAKTRHDIRDAVNTIVIQQSVLKEVIEFWRKENERIAANRTTK